MTVIFDAGELCLGILSLDIDPLMPPDGYFAEFGITVPPIRFPMFDQTQLRAISAEVRKKRRSFGDVLSDYGYMAHFFPDVFEVVDERFEFLEEYYPFFACFILHSFLSWMVCFKEERNLAYLRQLLRLLIALRKPREFSCWEKLRGLSATAFHFGFEDYLSFVPLEDCPVFFELLSRYVSDYKMVDVTLFVPSVDALVKTDRNRVCKIGRDLFAVIGITAEEIRQEFPRNIADEIVEKVMYLISSLDTTLLDVIAHLVPCVSPVLMIKVFQLLAQAIYQHIIRLKPVMVIKDVDAPHVIVTCQCGDEVVFGSGIKFAEKVKYGEALHEETARILKMVVKAVLTNHDYAKGFLTSFSTVFSRLEARQEYMFDVGIAFAFMCRNLIRFVEEERIIATLLSHPYFFATMNVFQPSEDYRKIDPLRTEVFELLMKVGKGRHVGMALTKWIAHPLLLAEIVHRVISNSSALEMTKASVEHLSNVLVHILMYYQRRVSHDERTTEVEIARKSIYTLIGHILSEQDARDLFFENGDFVEFFGTMVFDVSLRSFVLSCLCLYIDGQQRDISEHVIGLFSRIAGKCSDEFPDAHHVSILRDTLRMLNGIFGKQECFFVPRSTLFFSGFTTLGNDESSRSLVLEALKFLSRACVNEMLTEELVSILETTIDTCFAHDIPAELSDCLVKLIAGDCKAIVGSTFVIKHPNVLRIYMKTALVNGTAVEVARVIESLCACNVRNCVSCHNCGFDLYVIDALLLVRDDPPDVTEALLGLLGEIGVVVSSVAVVQRFIGLLSSSEEKLPKHQLSYIHALNSICSRHSTFPAASISLSHETRLEINGVTGADIDNGITLLVWMLVDSGEHSSASQLVQMTDVKGREMRWLIDDSGFAYSVKKDGAGVMESLSAEYQTDVPFPLVIRFSSSGYGIELTMFVNGIAIKNVSRTMLKFRPESVRLYIGGSTKDTCVSIGPVGLYGYLSDEEIVGICEMCPSYHSAPTPKSLIIVIPRRTTGTIIPMMKAGRQRTSATLVQCTHNTRLSFTEALVEICKIETLLPLFAQLSLTSPDDADFPNICKAIVDLLATTLLVSEAAQESFVKAEGCSAIALFLVTMDERFIDYELYRKFADLVLSVSDMDLQRELLNRVILNQEIWTRCTPDEHMLVLCHWAQEVFGRFREASDERISFECILFYLRAYYWYEPEDGCLTRGRIRDEGANISACRELLAQAAIACAVSSFSQHDLGLIHSSCLAISDNQQVVDLLQLYRLLMTLSPSPLECVFDGDTSFLFGLFTRCSECVYMSCLDTLWTLYECGLVSFEDVQIKLLRSVDLAVDGILTMSLLQVLVVFMNDRACHGVLSHCFRCASHIGDDSIGWLLSNISPNEIFGKWECWLLWPSIATLRVTSTATANDILKFVATCDTTCWSALFYTLYSVGDVIGEDKNAAIASLIGVMCDSLLVVRSISCLQCLACISSFFFFFRTIDESNTCINVPFKSSPFAGEDQTEQEAICEKQTKPNMCDITSKIAGEDVPSHNYRFGLRFNERGKWADEHTCVMTMEVLCMYRLYETIDLEMLIWCFLGVDWFQQVCACIRTRQLSASLKNSHKFMMVEKRALLGQRERFTVRDELNIHKRAFRQISLIAQADGLTVPSDIGAHFAALQIYLRRCLTCCSSADDVVIQSNEQMYSRIALLEAEGLENQRTWVRIWRCLAVDRAPWGRTLASAVHFTRDFTSCAFFCQSKLKRNWRFDDHTDASMARTTGRAVPRKGDVYVKPKMVRNNSITKREKVVLQVPCCIINPRVERSANFVLYRRRIRFVNDDGDGWREIQLDSVKYVFLRHYCHRRNSIEIFTTNGQNVLVHFPNNLALPILSKIAALPMPNLVKIQTNSMRRYFKQNARTDDWTSRKMSNFEYLMHLNMMSGRTFNDLTQYPIFPWIIASYDGNELGITSPATFRDLTKPVGALNEERLNELLSRMEMSGQFGKPFLYGASHSCLLTVCLFLIRLEPFTSQHIELQSGRFDQSSRIFHSIAGSYRAVTTRMNDFRELVPEFFFMPEFLRNMNHFDLGENENGVVDDVLLPKWAGSPYSFVYAQRKALESEIVSRSLCSWIDLIWGYKQTGEEAVKAHNVYKSDLYETVWDKVDSDDPLAKRMVEASLMNLGQMPVKLFTVRHPTRLPQADPAVKTNCFALIPKVEDARVAFVSQSGRKHCEIVIIDGNNLITTVQMKFTRKEVKKGRHRSQSMRLTLARCGPKLEGVQNV